MRSSRSWGDARSMERRKAWSLEVDRTFEERIVPGREVGDRWVLLGVCDELKQCWEEIERRRKRGIEFGWTS